MDCFNTIIGLRGLLDGNTSVTHYLDQCSITKDLVTKANYTHDQVSDLLTDKINEATNVVAAQVKVVKAPYLKTLDSFATNAIGHPIRNMTSVSTKTGYDAGASLELTSDTDFIQVNIDTIGLFAANTGNVTVSIYSLTEGRLLDTVTVAATAGQISTVSVNKTYRARQNNLALAFLYDSSFASYQCTAMPDQDCRSCAAKKLRQSRYSYVAGVKFADGDAKNLTNAVYESDTAGIIVNYSLKCDYEQWICRNRALLTLACLYYTAYHIAEYCLISPKFNSATLDQRNMVMQIRDFNLNRYNEEFNGVMAGMVLPDNSDCFLCRKQSTNVITL